MQKRLIILIVCLQIFIVIGLIFYILQKQKPAVSVTPLSKKELVFSESDTLKYFYDLKPNATYTQERSWLSYKATQTLNADSLNEQKMYSLEKPKSTYRIVTIGDSFTYGYYVNTPDNYPEQLEKLMNATRVCPKYTHYDVINLGVSGYDIRYQIERLNQKGTKYQPDLLIWLIKDDDFDQVLEVMLPKRNLYKNEFEADQNLLESYFKKGIYMPWKVKVEKELRDDYGLSSILEYQKKALRLINQYYLGPILIVTFSKTEKEKKEVLRAFAKERGNVFYYDSLVDIYKLNGALPDGHPNKEGYSLIAKDVYEYLQKNNVVSCR